jgi:hypothetical protein
MTFTDASAASGLVDFAAAYAAKFGALTEDFVGCVRVDRFTADGLLISQTVLRTIITA